MIHDLILSIKWVPAKTYQCRTWASPEESVPELAAAQPAHLPKGNPCKRGRVRQRNIHFLGTLVNMTSLLDLIHPEVYCGLRVTTLKPTVYKNQEKGMVKNQLQWFSFTCKACLFKSLRNAKFYTAKLVFCMKASEYISFLILLNYIFFHTKAHSVNL